MWKNNKNQIKQLLKTALAILCVGALFWLALVFPRYYYEHYDDNTLNRVTFTDIDVSTYEASYDSFIEKLHALARAYGTVEDPFIPAELVFGARGNFFARSIDVELATSQEVLAEAARHKGTSVVEILQNCVIFNNGIHNEITDREVRADRTILLRHGEKMIFGRDKNRGLVRDGFLLKAVTIGEDGYTLDDVLVHDAHEASNFLHQQLAMMDGHSLPLALGVIRDVEAPTYNDGVTQQVEEVRARKGFDSLRSMILAGETWTVE